MLPSLANRIAARPRRVLAGVALFVLLSVVLGGPLLGILTADNGFVDRGSDSARALDRVEAASGRDASPGSVVLLRTNEPARSAAGRAETARVARELAAVPGVAQVDSAASSRDPRFISRDGRTTYLNATFAASADEADTLDAVDDRFGDRPGVELGGAALAQNQLGEQISKDLGRAETFAFPVLVLLTFLFFRGGRAATLPLMVGAATIFSTFLVLRGVNEIHSLSIFCVNLVIGLGLGLAIDYTLFLLTRYREELEERGPGVEAVRATMATAGRTVAFSAVTVAIALATLIIFPLKFLQSMAIGGAVAAILAAVAACLIAPAFFAIWNVKLRARDRGGAHDRWYRIAQRVMRRPGAVAVITAVVMVALAFPALKATWTPVDAKTVPEGLSSRAVSDALASDFTGQSSSPVVIVAPGGADAAPRVRAVAQRTRDLPGIAAVQPPRRVNASTWQIDAITRGDAAAKPAREAVESIRAADSSLLVGGQAAAFLDQQNAIGSRLLLAILLLAAFTFAVLWLMTGSVVLPIKALVMNALTVGATLGVLKLVFQDGRFEGLLGYTSNGGIEPTDFLVTATLVFALSTDYGVFLLDRIKEAHDEGKSDREAVALGLGRTGSVVTAAAVLLAVAIGAFVTSEVLFIKEVGVGAALGVLIDAVVVRSLLVPSLMALLGPWNWWSPRPLRALHDRIGLREEAREPVAIS